MLTVFSFLHDFGLEHGSFWIGGKPTMVKIIRSLDHKKPKGKVFFWSQII